MAPQRSKRQSRKRRQTGGAGRVVAPAPAPRREVRAERRVLTEREQRRGQYTLKAYGERPQSPFGGLPVSEFGIFIGGLGALVGFVSQDTAALLVGIVICILAVIEVTAREHFSGYRSHAMLLASVPAVGLLAASVALFGAPQDRSARELLLLTAVPVFAVLFWLLRKRFRTARQARLVRPPVP